MTAAEIRKNGIDCPGNGFVSTGDDRAVTANLGIIAGALIEIAAQLAELNEKLTVQGLVSTVIDVQAALDERDPR